MKQISIKRTPKDKSLKNVNVNTIQGSNNILQDNKLLGLITIVRIGCGNLLMANNSFSHPYAEKNDILFLNVILNFNL